MEIIAAIFIVAVLLALAERMGRVIGRIVMRRASRRIEKRLTRVEPAEEPAAIGVPNDACDYGDRLPDYPMQARVKREWLEIAYQNMERERKARWN